MKMCTQLFGHTNVLLGQHSSSAASVQPRQRRILATHALAQVTKLHTAGLTCTLHGLADPGGPPAPNRPTSMSAARSSPNPDSRNQRGAHSCKAWK